MGIEEWISEGDVEFEVERMGLVFGIYRRKDQLSMSQGQQLSPSVLMGGIE